MTRIAALPESPSPMPRLTPEQARREREAIAAALRAACQGSDVRLADAFHWFASGVRP